METNPKKCKLCRAEFDNNPFIYCNNCMDLLRQIGKFLRETEIEKNNPKVYKMLFEIQIGKYDFKENLKRVKEYG